ncbi:hypothetical protein EDF46_0329 [Frondihabitans sp. PhB188]|uniref:hypothetical protein n=1 Tax=Frondihabitans sp. PhB188 TaxID=2485200 RepID=UPI000F9FD627|nr:hypothetical protein [Frondihabitans sp. PhB188]ROQ40963.1 hypothetical protein EDF46_0329 [Frondihabitans sp. PhB188]
MTEYPHIVQARDPWGNVAQLSPTDAYGEPSVMPNVLEVGQHVHFVVEASEPVTWVPFAPGARIDVTPVVGQVVEFDWVVTESQVRLRSAFLFHAVGEGRFHRHGEHDDTVQFVYEVQPADVESWQAYAGA